MEKETRIQMLRPAQICDRIVQCPVVYIPLGVLEWHGEHNPFGADTLQAEGIAKACALEGGGLVFPPLYYGLFQDKMETIPRFQKPIIKRMGWRAEAFDITHMLDNPQEERERYVHLLIHILCEAESLGFHVAVFVAGHYPLIDLARAAILEFMDSRKFEDRKTMVAWAFADFLLMEDYYSNPGDHGACWETSHLMFLHPDTVDLSLLEEHDKDLIGILITNHSPREASAVFGQETIEKTTHEVLREVKKRLTNPGYYRNHGRALMEK